MTKIQKFGDEFDYMTPKGDCWYRPKFVYRMCTYILFFLYIIDDVMLKRVSLAIFYKLVHPFTDGAARHI